MLRNLFRLLILFAALAITASAQQPAQPSKTWVVVVGISKYQKLPGGQQLQFADRDAALFAESTQKRGVGAYNLRLLTGPDATVAAIKSAVGTWLARSVSESDTVIFFFSGHGLFEREFGEAYLLGYDSDAKDPFGTALAVSELRRALGNRIRAGRVLVLVDAVRRDFFDPENEAGSSKSFVQAFEQLTAARRGLSAIIASGPGEFSREGQRWAGHGVFTKHLADVLSEGPDRNGDGTLTADELFEVLATRVSDDTSGKQHLWKSGSALDQIAVARVESHTQAKTITPKTPAESDNKPTDVRATANPTQQVRQDAAAPPANPSAPVVSATKQEPPPQPKQNAQPGTATLADKVNIPTSSGDPNKARRAAETESKTPTIVTPNRGALAKSEVPNTTPPPKSVGAPNSVSPSSPKPPTSNASVSREPKPPGTETVQRTPSLEPTRPEPARSEIAIVNIPSPPKPTMNPPAGVSVSADRSGSQPETLATSVPARRPGPAPSPLVLQLEAAIKSNNLIEPRNSSAWDFYQRLASEPEASADLARLRPMLGAALGEQGRAIVSGDVRGDNISDRVDDFKRAGQLFARARTLTPDRGDVVALEKLSAAEALISLQFYDEAERALSQLQDTKLAAVENAFGLVYHGKLDSFRAERSFKRAIELDAKWAAPHYNLALLYRSQQKQESLAELEAAAALDPNNVNLVAALAEEYFTRQQFKQAADEYRKAVSLKPTDDGLHTKLGHALYSQGLQDEANREYQKASELRGKRP
jgi:tetratricopeptide (TPR) repeat protein/uncharacterized caspase-like protein